MKVYHVTTVEAAFSIDSEGFRDGCGNYLTDHEHRGVWVSDRPLDAQSGFDEPAVFEIEIDEVLLQPCEWIEDGKGYREWLIPSAIVNSAKRRRIDRAT